MISRIDRSHPARVLSTSVIVVTIALALTAGGLLGISGFAQHATPTSATGITTEVLGQGLPSDVPGKSLWLMRIPFEPGAVSEVNEGDEPTVILVSNLRGEGEPARLPAATPAS